MEIFKNIFSLLPQVTVEVWNFCFWTRKYPQTVILQPLLSVVWYVPAVPEGDWG